MISFEFFSNGDSEWHEMGGPLPEDPGVATTDNCMVIDIPGLGRRFVEEVECEVVETRLG